VGSNDNELRRRSTDKCDYRSCPVNTRTNLLESNHNSMQSYFDEINKRLNVGSEKMKILSDKQDRNYRADRLILVMGVISLCITIFRSM